MSEGKSSKNWRRCELSSCRKLFLPDPSNVRKGGGRFCSKRCKGQWQRGKCFHAIIPLEERFRKMTGKKQENGCMFWLGCLNKKGYGKIKLPSGRSVRAHRLSYELFVGPIPKGHQVHHNCPGGDSPSCVNPAHLWAGTQLENMRDMQKKERKKTRLTAKMVKEIRKKHSQGISQKSLAAAYHVAANTISGVVNRRTWKFL